MKRIIISLLVLMVVLCTVLVGCSKEDTTQTTVSNDPTTAPVGVTLTPPQGAAMYEFKKYGYHIYHPQGFEVLNNEGNMVEFMNDTGVDFTVLVLENNYDSLNAMINSQVDDEEDEIVKRGSNYILVYNASNGRTNYTYYYYGEDMVRCELSYPDAQKEAMKGLEEKIMVEVHTHSH